MEEKIKSFEAPLFVSMLILTGFLTILLPTVSQPQGYTLIYAPPRAYNASDWMDIKAVYIKETQDKLYFYIEYYAPMPNSSEYIHNLFLYMDTDRNPQTGSLAYNIGIDSYINIRITGNNQSSWANLYKWDPTANGWKNLRDLKPDMKMAPSLSYWEVPIKKEDIAYSPTGMDFYISAYWSVLTIPATKITYTIGSNNRQITVDGNPSDWGTATPTVSLKPRGINPPELEISAIYLANDAENLYVRVDTRGKPTQSIPTGTLTRELYIYIDTDNSNSTGYKTYSGADYYAYATLNTQILKYPNIYYYKYTGTGTDSKWQQVSSTPQNADFNTVFELKIPLSLLGLKPQQKITIYIPEQRWFLHRLVPKTVTSITYPTQQTATTPATQPSIIARLFGSETLFLALVTTIIILEAAAITYLARKQPRHQPQPPPPPP
jgi:hypothetical protein